MIFNKKCELLYWYLIKHQYEKKILISYWPIRFLLQNIILVKKKRFVLSTLSNPSGAVHELLYAFVVILPPLSLLHGGYDGTIQPLPPVTLMQSVTEEKILSLVTFTIIQCHITIFYAINTINPPLTGESISIESMGIVYQQPFFYLIAVPHIFSDTNLHQC